MKRISITKKLILAILFATVNFSLTCKAEATKILSIQGINLGKSKNPCTPSAVKYYSSYSGGINKIMMMCSIKKPNEIITITFSSDKKRIVRVIREQYLTQNDASPNEILKSAINHYGTPSENKYSSFAIYGTAHYCNDCITDIKLNKSGEGLLICISSGWNIERRIFDKSSNGVVYELINIQEYDEATTDGEANAIKFYRNKLSKQKF